LTNVFISMPVIHSAEESHIALRSFYSDLSVSQVQSMPNISIREKSDWAFYGHSTINHSYGLKVIIGANTGLPIDFFFKVDPTEDSSGNGN
jgi:hypothetical protein